MKAVVNAVTSIVEDIRMFERRPRRDRAEIDSDTLRALQDRLEATLSNLVSASKTHATSNGMSPVSLLDAAASHVSSTVTEIGKTLCVRKATKAEQDQFVQLPLSSASPGGSFSPFLRSVNEERSVHSRGGSSASVRSFGMGESRYGDMPSPPQNRSLYGRMSTEEKRRPPSNPSSSDASASSPPPIFDHPTSMNGVTSDDSATAEGPEDAWSELKVRRVIICPVLIFLTSICLIFVSHTSKHRLKPLFMRFNQFFQAFEVRHPRLNSTSISHKSSRSSPALLPFAKTIFHLEQSCKAERSYASSVNMPTRSAKSSLTPRSPKSLDRSWRSPVSLLPMR